MELVPPTTNAVSRLVTGVAFAVIAVVVVTAMYPLVLSAAAIGFLFDRKRRRPSDYVVQMWARLSMIVFFAGVTVENAEVLPPAGEAVMYCPNHCSFLDIFTLSGYLPRRFKYISKIEILRIPLIGWAMGFAKHIAIRRTDRASQLKTLKDAIETLKDGNSLVTCARDAAPTRTYPHRPPQQSPGPHRSALWHRSHPPHARPVAAPHLAAPTSTPALSRAPHAVRRMPLQLPRGDAFKGWPTRRFQKGPLHDGEPRRRANRAHLDCGDSSLPAPRSLCPLRDPARSPYRMPPTARPPCRQAGATHARRVQGGNHRRLAALYAPTARGRGVGPTGAAPLRRRHRGTPTRRRCRGAEPPWSLMDDGALQSCPSRGRGLGRAHPCRARGAALAMAEPVDVSDVYALPPVHDDVDVAEVWSSRRGVPPHTKTGRGVVKRHSTFAVIPTFGPRTTPPRVACVPAGMCDGQCPRV